MLLYKELEQIKLNFFQAVCEGDSIKVQRAFENKKLCPWEFLEEEGYTGKSLIT